MRAQPSPSRYREVRAALAYRLKQGLTPWPAAVGIRRGTQNGIPYWTPAAGSAPLHTGDGGGTSKLTVFTLGSPLAAAANKVST